MTVSSVENLYWTLTLEFKSVKTPLASGARFADTSRVQQTSPLEPRSKWPQPTTLTSSPSQVRYDVAGRLITDWYEDNGRNKRWMKEHTEGTHKRKIDNENNDAAAGISCKSSVSSETAKVMSKKTPYFKLGAKPKWKAVQIVCRSSRPMIQLGILVHLLDATGHCGGFPQQKILKELCRGGRQLIPKG